MASTETLHNRNLYTYCNQNPLTRSDGNGHLWTVAAGIIGGVISLGKQLWYEKKEMSWKVVAQAALDGASWGLAKFGGNGADYDGEHRRFIINMLNDYDKYDKMGRMDMANSVLRSSRIKFDRWHIVQFEDNIISDASKSFVSNGVSFLNSKIRGRYIGSGMEYIPGQKPRYFDIYDRNGVLYRDYR